MNVEDIFIQAIRDKKKVKIRFQSKQDSVEKERICAPMDYGPSRRTHDRSNRYHLWDYDSASGPHTLLLLPEQLISVKTLDEYFDPKEFVKWDLAKSAWSISRDWGDYS